MRKGRSRRDTLWMVRRMFYIKAIRISRLKGVENLQKVKARVSSEKEKFSAARFIHPVRYQMIQRGGIADSVHQIPEPISLSGLHSPSPIYGKLSLFVLVFPPALPGKLPRPEIGVVPNSPDSALAKPWKSFLGFSSRVFFSGFRKSSTSSPMFPRNQL